MTRYVVASAKDWFLKAAKSRDFLSLDMHYINSKDELNIQNLEEINPRYIFFRIGTGSFLVRFMKNMSA